MARVMIVGEGMLELSAAESGWRLAYGGDTLNTAIHLARQGENVAFATALGTDAFSDELLGFWQREGLDTGLVLRDPSRLPGLYAIRTDPDGERSFTYWRSESAARGMFGLPDAHRLMEVAASVDLLFFSLISLAILRDDGREALLDLAVKVRAAGGRVAFDGNYRARLWNDAAEARAMRDRAIAVCDIGLPTLEDEAAIEGTTLSAEAVAARWTAGGAAETVVKLGPDGCLAAGTRVPPEARLHPVDTSGAGDAFNAGYLHARLSGATPEQAARMGHRLAGWVLMHRGAVPPVSGGAPYRS